MFSLRRPRVSRFVNKLSSDGNGKQSNFIRLSDVKIYIIIGTSHIVEPLKHHNQLDRSRSAEALFGLIWLKMDSRKNGLLARGTQLRGV